MLNQLRQFYADHVDPDGIQPRQALRTMIAGILAIFVYHALPWHQAYWVLVSTVLLLQTYIGDYPNEKMRHLLIATVCATICTYIASRLISQTSTLALFLALTTFTAYYSYAIATTVGNIAVYINLFCLSAAALTINLTDSWQRAASVAIGGIIAFLVCLCCFPERLSSQLRRSIEQLLLRLADFNLTLLKRPQETKMISVRRNRFIRGIRLALQQTPEEELQTQVIIDKVTTLYEIILTLHQLHRYARKAPTLTFLTDKVLLCLQQINQLLLTMAHPISWSADHSLDLPDFAQDYVAYCQPLNTLSTLALIVYIDSIDKLKNISIELRQLLQRKSEY